MTLSANYLNGTEFKANKSIHHHHLWADLFFPSPFSFSRSGTQKQKDKNLGRRWENVHGARGKIRASAGTFGLKVLGEKDYIEFLQQLFSQLSTLSQQRRKMHSYEQPLVHLLPKSPTQGNISHIPCQPAWSQYLAVFRAGI